MNFEINSIYGDIIDVSVDSVSTGSMSRLQSAVFLIELLETAQQLAYHLDKDKVSRKTGDLLDLLHTKSDAYE